MPSWFDRTDHEPRNFDKWLCKLLRTMGFELRLLYPYLCQHIGVVSKVRADVPFYWDDRATGRIGLGVSGACLITKGVHIFTDLPSEIGSHCAGAARDGPL